ncbi:transcriptional regulator [Caproiciproducens galactitolivorans]|uniref:SigmaK-factor processing regulatory protein BofA n=1 Tax=Caproiciproducens galactitolivorans TaxID=642589 RepID=A0A4Z0Y2J5_9FIRM|nr:pro-sigmaK processing inhibitor BofA family protein [Caproiciproducens galactitolivorans]QEY34302.1 transcriptional regulator [Caproiciproducens galactitolivorans]TGJ77934.1 sigmaK-factor processing regulatory protein BofA [Caproiciproducens galactitolivorans]
MPNWVVPLSLCGVFALLVLIQVIVKAPKPVQRAAGGVLTGLCALAAVNLTGFFTGVSLPLSPLTIGVSGAAGIPGVTMLLLLNLIIK